MMRVPNSIIHVFGCIVFLSLPFLFSPDTISFSTIVNVKPFQRELLRSVLLLVFFYASYYVFIPKYYIPKKIVVFVGVVILSFLVISFLPEALMLGHKRHVAPAPPQNFPHPPRKFGILFFLGRHVVDFLIVLIFSLLLKIRERLKQTETEKANAELSYLKAQINPHFLFNTLNSIYSLAILKSDKTANAVVKLSDMMRYVLNDGKTNFVELEKEINYIDSYIELQRMRLAANIKLKYSYEGNVHDKKIAPLVLIPFIENAFKHGVNTEEDSEITIKITITDLQLNMVVENKCVTSNNDTLNKSGLGIENTVSRLKLLYPENYTLNINENSQIFTVSLTLNIHD